VFWFRIGIELVLRDDAGINQCGLCPILVDGLALYADAFPSELPGIGYLTDARTNLGENPFRADIVDIGEIYLCITYLRVFGIL